MNKEERMLKNVLAGMLWMVIIAVCTYFFYQSLYRTACLYVGLDAEQASLAAAYTPTSLKVDESVVQRPR